MPKLISSGQVGDMNFFIQSTNKGVEIEYKINDNTGTKTFQSWNQAENWMNKQIAGVYSNEIE